MGGRRGRGWEAVAGGAHHLAQAGLVDGQVAGVPATDAPLVLVDHGDLDGGVLEGDDRCGRAA